MPVRTVAIAQAPVGLADLQLRSCSLGPLPRAARYVHISCVLVGWSSTTARDMYSTVSRTHIVHAILEILLGPFQLGFLK